MFKREDRRLIISVFLATVILGFAIGTVYAQSFTTYIEGGSQVNLHDYIIFKDGSTYHTRNSLTGQVVDYSNFTILMNTVVTDLSGSGGNMFLKEGVYYTSGIITWADSVNLEGEDTYNTYIVPSRDVAYIIDARDTRRFYISSITISGANYSTKNIDLSQTSSRAVDITFKRVATYGAKTTGLDITNCEDFVAYDSEFHASGVANVYIGENNGINTFDNCRFLRGPADAGDGANYLSIWGNSTVGGRTIFSDCVIEADTGNEPSGDIIRITDYAEVWFENTWIVTSGSYGVGLFGVVATPPERVSLLDCWLLNKDPTSTKQVISGNFTYLQIIGGVIRTENGAVDVIYPADPSGVLMMTNVIVNNDLNYDHFDNFRVTDVWFEGNSTFNSWGS